MDNRVKMINGMTGTIMLVPAPLVDEFMKAGHRKHGDGKPSAAKPSKEKAVKTR